MKYKRSSGIILHPTSFPGPYGIGDLGPHAYRWIDFLSDIGCSLWQVLPLGPTGYGDSPYQCFSAFAGNPYLINPDALVEENFIDPSTLEERPKFPSERVDYGQVITWKLKLLDHAYTFFLDRATPEQRIEYQDFHASQAFWLDDFALFMALKEANNGKPWPTWEAPLRDRHPQAIEHAREIYAAAIHRQIFRQFIFYKQWNALHNYATEHGIKIVGDIPIFVAHDSADVWAHPELFYLDKKGHPKVVAGVPPDYFSATGQLWGNPLYRWRVHASDGYRWWINRIRSVLECVDFVRIDHFRGFAGYWEVPGKAKTAIKGRWVKGPGRKFFQAVLAELGELPILAEDLGVITPDVVNLRDSFGLPGMKILQFGFEGGPTDPFLPHNYPVNCVAYTGTHDNDTMQGWFERISDDAKLFALRYLNTSRKNISWDSIRAVWGSVAVFAFAPLQDFLALGNDARMNYPGNPSGNWGWRMASDTLNDDLSKRITELNYLYNRKPLN